MKTRIGLWIDHRRAVIVQPSDTVEDINVILSNTERHPGRDDVERPREAFESLQVQADDVTDRKFEQHLNTYYDEVIACVKGANSLLIMGPGEAKGELVRRLEHKHKSERVVEVETTDKLTDRQVVAKVHEHFKAVPPVIELQQRA
jgi:hypothetical protein